MRQVIFVIFGIPKSEKQNLTLPESAFMRTIFREIPSVPANKDFFFRKLDLPERKYLLFQCGLDVGLQMIWVFRASELRVELWNNSRV